MESYHDALLRNVCANRGVGRGEGGTINPAFGAEDFGQVSLRWYLLPHGSGNIHREGEVSEA